MRELVVPASLREIFGERQTPADLAIVLGAGLPLTALVALLGVDSLAAVEWWRSALAVLLLLDVCCGCVATFTRGTDRWYAEHRRSRWVFLAIHWHLPVIALLLGDGLGFAVLAWAFAILGGMAVNLLHGSPLQPPVGGALLAGGLVGVALAAADGDAPFLIVATTALFLLKVIGGFAVTHFREGRDADDAGPRPGGRGTPTDQPADGAQPADRSQPADGSPPSSPASSSSV